MTAEMAARTAISCRGLNKAFGAAQALVDFNLDVQTGQLLALLGPSGCGKTTALRAIAGFETMDSGTVTIGQRAVVGPDVWVPPEKRRVGMVFQDYALFPHMTVARNVGFGLPGGEHDTRIREVLAMVGLTGLGDRMPNELSGGEQQRVALARALAPQPDVLLLDEPFSNLDAPQRDKVRREVRNILVEARATTVFVTHDQEEALAMSDVVAVMRKGTIVQVAPPHDLYHRPVDAWVARFLSEGELIPGVARDGLVETSLGRFRLATAVEGQVEVMVRPEAVRLSRSENGAALVVDREFYGHDQLVMIEILGGRRLLSRAGASPLFNPGERVSVEIDEVVAFEPEGPSRDHPDFGS